MTSSFFYQQGQSLAFLASLHFTHQSKTHKQDTQTQTYNNTGANVTVVLTVEAQWDSAIFGDCWSERKSVFLFIRVQEANTESHGNCPFFNSISFSTSSQFCSIYFSFRSSEVPLFIKTFSNWKEDKGQDRGSVSLPQVVLHIWKIIRRCYEPSGRARGWGRESTVLCTSPSTSAF